MNPSPVRAMPERVSAQRSRSTAEGLNGSVTAVRLTVRTEALVERHAAVRRLSSVARSASTAWRSGEACGPVRRRGRTRRRRARRWSRRSPDRTSRSRSTNTAATRGADRRRRGRAPRRRSRGRTRRCRRAPGRHGRRSAPPVGSGATAAQLLVECDGPVSAARGRWRRPVVCRGQPPEAVVAGEDLEYAYPLGCEATTAPSMSNPTSANARGRGGEESGAIGLHDGAAPQITGELRPVDGSLPGEQEVAVSGRLRRTECAADVDPASRRGTRRRPPRPPFAARSRWASSTAGTSASTARNTASVST